MTDHPAESAPNHAGLLARVRDAYADYTAAIDAVSEDELTTPAIASWSVRDVMAHVGADEQWLAGQLEAQAGIPPTALSCYGSEEYATASVDLTTQDARNAWQYERLRGLTLDEVRDMAATGHARLMAAIESFPDEQLAETLTIAQLETMGHIRKPAAGEQGWPLWEWLRGVTYHHYADHAAAIRAAAGR
ncbi:MAG: ClbS/DfsB family four-helix bundle protein [Dehalococcoidia bacterium]